MNQFGIAFCISAVIVIMIGALVYGSTTSNQRYYAAMSDCTAKGGTWIPYGNGSSSAACVMGNAEKITLDANE